MEKSYTPFHGSRQLKIANYPFGHSTCSFALNPRYPQYVKPQYVVPPLRITTTERRFYPRRTTDRGRTELTA